MPDTTYTVVFNGETLNGFDREQVKKQFSTAFKVDQEKTERIFSRKRVVLKKALPLGAAQRYIQKLRALGLQAVLEPSDRASAPPPEPRPAAESPYSTLFNRSSNAPQPPASQGRELTQTGKLPHASSYANLELIPIDKPEAEQEAQAPEGMVRPTAVKQNKQRPDIQFLSMTEANEFGFTFTGKGGEYFRIWIVNIALSLVTLGIYSAWAKVRTKRYFYGNTFLLDNSFEYLARPVKILIGRLIALVLIILYVVLEMTEHPILGSLPVVAFVIMMPWIISRAIAFRNRNSAWRGIRFGFEGGVLSGSLPYIVMPFLAGILFILWPLTFFMQKRFMISYSSFGTHAFEFHAGIKEFYRIFFALVFAVAGFIIAFIYLIVTNPGLLEGIIPFLIILLLYTFFLAYYKVNMANLVYNNTTLGMNKLSAQYDFTSYFLLVLTNTLFIIFTLGLFYPWARVRTAQYAADHTSVIADGDLDRFLAHQQSDVSATGGELGDFLSFDIGF